MPPAYPKAHRIGSLPARWRARQRIRAAADDDGARVPARSRCTAPAPRKAAPKATAAPARSCSASWRRMAAASAIARSTPASGSCRPSTARSSSPSRACGSGRPLHPVQQAMVDHHGSQCGFCTPGFVMSMFALYLRNRCAPTREQVLDALSGNLCRCTGYRPIIDAGMRMGSYPTPAHWSRDARALDPRACAALASAAARCSSLRLPGFHAPRTSRSWPRRSKREPDRVAARRRHRRRPVGHEAVARSARRSSISARSPSSAAHPQRRARASWIGAAVAVTDAWGADRGRVSRTGRTGSSASAPRRSAIPARCAAISRTARRSAIRCRR